MACPDSSEIELVSQLRKNVSDLNLSEKFTTDHFLIRWIRARQHNLEQAEKMLRQHMKWREENDVDNISSWHPPEVLLTGAPIEFLGFDDENSPVLFLPAGTWEIKKMLEAEDNATCLKFMQKFLEFGLRQMEGKLTSSGFPVTQFVVIIDHKGMSYWNVLNWRAIDIRRQILRTFEANLPETIKTAHVINCKSVFAAIFAIIKPLLSSATAAKVNIFTSDEPKWKMGLQERIPSSILSPYLGGTNDNTLKSADFMKTKESDEKHKSQTNLELCEFEVPITSDKEEVDFGFE